MVQPAVQDSTSTQYTFPPETRLIPEGNEYVNLEVIDISQFNGQSSESLCAGMRKAVEQAMRGLSTTGFIVLKGHGLSSADIQHQFSLGNLLLYGVSDEEKLRLHAQIKEGSWAGYKRQGYFKRPHGGADVVEHYDLYPFTAIDSMLPEKAKPYLQDIRSFIEHNHYDILKRVLQIISLGLGLESDSLWKLHHREECDDDSAQMILRQSANNKVEWKHTKDHLRYVIYYPHVEEDRIRHGHLLVPGHTDLGSVTFLYSQPVAGLQVRLPTGEWKYIRYYKDQILLGLGDSMEFLTGGVLKAPPHRVKEPPQDQRHFDRPGIFYFVPFLGDIPLTPINHPSLVLQGAKDIFKDYYDHGGRPMLSDEWLVERSKLIGTKRPEDEQSGARKALYDIAFRYNSS